MMDVDEFKVAGPGVVCFVIFNSGVRLVHMVSQFLDIMVHVLCWETAYHHQQRVGIYTDRTTCRTAGS